MMGWALWWLVPSAEAALELPPVQFGAAAAGGVVFALQQTDLEVHVQAGLAVVDLHQVWYNPSSTPIDATYVLPLPPDAAVRSLELRCGGRTIHGEVRSREAARQAYTEAREAGRTAGLLEQERANWFTQTIGGICPGETIAVDVQFVTTPDNTDQTYSLVLPTTVGERYDPGTLREPPHRPARHPQAPALSLSMTIAEGMPLASLWSDTHDIQIDDEGPWGAALSLLEDGDIPNRDVVISWSMAAEQPQASALYLPGTDGEDGYISVMIEPPALEHLPPPQPRELIFVLDASGSMAGRPWQDAVSTVTLALGDLTSWDTFNLVRFSGDAQPLFATSMPATAENVARARAWMEDFSGGATEMEAGLRRALQLPSDDEALRMVLLLTDGFIGNEEQIYRMIQQERGETRVFALGVGASVNHLLLESVARAGQGDAFLQLPDAPADEARLAFQRRIARPALTDVQLQFTELAVHGATPAVLPDLWAGQSLRVVARTNDPLRGEVLLSGLLGGQPYQRRIPLQRLEATSEALEVVWAREQIADLQTQLDRPLAERRADITALALEYHLVGPYTSLVAVADRPSRCVSTPETTFAHAEPHLHPQGVREVAVQYKAPTAIDFQGIDVQGELVRPSGMLLLERRRSALNPLIPLRADFTPEMRDSLVGLEGVGTQEDALVLWEALLESRADLRACVDGPLHADVQGDIHLRLEIRAGRVVSVRVVRDTTGVLGPAACMQARISRWSLDEETDLTVTLPIRLR